MQVELKGAEEVLKDLPELSERSKPVLMLYYEMQEVLDKNQEVGMYVTTTFEQTATKLAFHFSVDLESYNRDYDEK